MSNYNDLLGLLKLAGEMLKDQQIAKAREEVRAAAVKLSSISVHATREKINELNKSLFIAKRELERLKLMITSMEKFHNIDLDGFREELKIFDETIEELRLEKKNTGTKR